MNEQAKKMSQIMAKCWADEEFKERFKKEPEAVLKEYGIEVEAGMKYSVVENTESVTNIVIPTKPSEILSDEDLDAVAGGGGGCGGTCICV